MKILSLLVLCILVSCTSSRIIISKQMPDSYVEVDEPDKQQRQFLIKVQIKKNDEVWMTPQINLNEGKLATVRVGDEKFLPIKWNSPEIVQKDDQRVFRSASPVFDKSLLFGFEMELFASRVETLNSKSWVHLQGRFTNREEEVQKVLTPEKIEVLNNFASSHTTDTNQFSFFIKDNSIKAWSFVSGKNEYDLKFYVKEI